MLCCAMLCYAILCCHTLLYYYYAILCHIILMLSYCYPVLYYAILLLWYAMLYYAMPCFTMLYYAVLCYIMLCYYYAILCYAITMLYYAILLLCYAMLYYYYAMPCYTMLCFAAQDCHCDSILFCNAEVLWISGGYDPVSQWRCLVTGGSGCWQFFKLSRRNLLQWTGRVSSQESSADRIWFEPRPWWAELRCSQRNWEADNVCRLQSPSGTLTHATVIKKWLWNCRIATYECRENPCNIVYVLWDRGPPVADIL